MKNLFAFFRLGFNISIPSFLPQGCRQSWKRHLVGFIAHPNPQIRLAATEALVPYSTAETAVFKADDLKPVRNLKLLVRDQPKIAEHVLDILVNLSADAVVLDHLAGDQRLLELLFLRLVDKQEPNANLISMLLANLAKSQGFEAAILRAKQPSPPDLGADDVVLNQLLDLFVKGHDGRYNKAANYDYLAYLFADLAKNADVRRYFVEPQRYDDVIPLTKIKVFTEHTSTVRRKGVASTIKNVAFDVQSHPSFLSETGINILPYVLLPIAGADEYDADDMMEMLPDLQLLPPDKTRDTDSSIVQTHVETLTLLTTTRQGRDLMRRVKVYPVVRETHLRVDDEGVREACERLVQVLMRDEEPEVNERVQEVQDDEDDEIIPV
ncbi:hypothetical protein L249_4394 [Ophiocordyceps polyrhachis-furcata BCC 54312]|uniref:Protein HGH1 homolog n=1 Tax=Ophiocordyceps polyrhachis-furcata BCC 54312 TaxID=1330021 RepID=A0A367L7K3_9HYPO|nr:hypothetical protein L249_4394 [Ophiocordyceps polyrhachis-furcata BCC 54312]